MVTWTRGSDMPPALQQECLRSFVHRYTGDHKPDWARKPWKGGRPYPLQFRDDRDWLAHTYFPVTKAGNLALRPSDCQSNPTWPETNGERPT